MTGKIFLDTNIIVYSFDKTDSSKNKKAKQLLDLMYENYLYVISTQVIQEFCNVSFRKMDPPLSEEDVRLFISTFPAGQIATIDMETINQSLMIKKRYKYSFWDSLILATAMMAGCGILFSEDMKHDLKIEDLLIQNPFI
jgi:predicted nucleic acid-binding protein